MSDKKSIKNIMVADDDPAILEVIKLMLETEGYEVSITDNAQPIKKLKSKLPDLLLLDIWMSGEDGRELCRQLKNQPETKNLPIIMVSANKDTEKIARESGADDFIEKPFEMTTLLSKVKKITSK